MLWWNVIDGWPQFSDAIVDYYFGNKLAYHYHPARPAAGGVIVGEPGAGQIPAGDHLQRHAAGRRRALPSLGCRQRTKPLLQATFRVPANQNWQVGRIRTYASDQRLYLIEWETDGQRFGSHYLAGTPPFGLDRYQSAWLPAIARLESPFDAGQVAR